MFGSTLLDLMFWLYFTNVTFLFIHEMDSVYWKEWELFKIPGGHVVFLLINIPMVVAGLFGLIAFFQWINIGLLFSFIISILGVLAFVIHTIFFLRGHDEFKAPFSIALLIIILLVSIAQFVVTLLVYL